MIIWVCFVDVDIFVKEMFKREIFERKYSIMSYMVARLMRKSILVSVLSSIHFIGVCVCTQDLGYNSTIYALVYGYMLVWGILLSLGYLIVIELAIRSRLGTFFYAILCFLCFLGSKVIHSAIEKFSMKYILYLLPIGYLFPLSHLSTLSNTKYFRLLISFLESLSPQFLSIHDFHAFEMLISNSEDAKAFVLRQYRKYSEIKDYVSIYLFSWRNINDRTSIALFFGMVVLNVVMYGSILIYRQCPSIRTKLGSKN